MLVLCLSRREGPSTGDSSRSAKAGFSAEGFLRGAGKKSGGRGGRGRLRLHRDREGRKAQAVGQKHVSTGIGAGLRWQEAETVGDDLYRATSTLPSAADPSSPALLPRPRPAPSPFTAPRSSTPPYSTPASPLLTPLRPAPWTCSGKRGGAGTSRAVCPLYSLQWEVWRREGGLEEGLWCVWWGGGWRLSGFRAVGEGRRWWLGGWLGRAMRPPRRVTPIHWSWSGEGRDVLGG